MTRFLNFGASISSGFWDPGGGWFHYLSRDLHERALEKEEDFQCYNLGVSGHNSRQILERIEDEIESRKLEDRGIVILISCGGNDALYEHERGQNQISLEEFRQNLDKILEIASGYTEKIFFVGNQPVDYNILDPLPWDRQKSVKKEHREKYMQKAEEVCREKNVPFLSISENVEEKEFRQKLVDGIHPGTEGHREIYKSVKDFLQEEGAI